MGGKFWNLPRMPRADYLVIEAAIRGYLDDGKAPGEYRVPRYFADKADFGDMDVLISSEVLRRTPKFLDNLRQDLGITQFDRASGSTYTTVFRGLQTDFFVCPPSNLESSYSFMCFGEVGNILGRMGRRFRLKFGVDGLSYVFRSGDHHKAEFPLTKDFARVCELFGLDYAAWVAGFPTREDMFRWATSSPLFSARPYLAEDGPLTERTGMRPSMLAFIDYVRAHVSPEAGGYIPDPVAWLDAAFPQAGLPAKIAKQEQKVATLAAVAEKFSGRLVMGIHPNLEGKPLGEFIRLFRGSKTDFHAYVLATTPEQIREDIRTFNLTSG